MADFPVEYFEPSPSFAEVAQLSPSPVAGLEFFVPTPFFGEVTVNGPSASIPVEYFAPCTAPNSVFFHQGYYVLGATFEYWVAQAPLSPPPSGHALLDIVYAQITG